MCFNKHGIMFSTRFYGFIHRFNDRNAIKLHNKCLHRMSKMFLPAPNLQLSGTGESHLKSKSDVSCRSQEFLTNDGFISRVSDGIHTILPLAHRSLKKLISVIEEEMDSIGMQRLLMPSVVHHSYFEKSGRWEQYSQELFTFKDRHKAEFCLAPTHEEIVTSLVAASGISKKNLPLGLYQISTKFRDEMRPRYGLLRAKEFIMKDLYTFDLDEQSASATYDKVCQCYERLFQRLQLDVIKVKATTGLIGGKHSDEYHILAEVGEDTLLFCEGCRIGFNTEVCTEDSTCRCCGRQLVSKRAIEIGHAFLLGTRYSKPFELKINSREGHSYVEMGCFGLGVSRILAAAVESLSTDDSMRFPRLIAPFTVSVVTPKKGSKEEANNVTEFSEHLSIELSRVTQDDVLIDDRSQYTIGRRIKDSKLLGIPYVVVAGKKAMCDVPKLELICTVSNQVSEVTQKEALDFFRVDSQKVFEKYF